jgi:putative membrane protein
MKSETAVAYSFNPLIRKYIFLVGAFILLFSVIGIPILPFWLFGMGQWYSRLYFEKLECELSDRTLRFKQGILFQFEKTIPLDNIQDMTFFEGPLLRQFNLSNIKIETAGHNPQAGSSMSLIGIIDAQQFRNDILERRSALQGNSNGQKDPLIRIADKLDSIYTLLEKRNEKP